MSALILSIVIGLYRYITENVGKSIHLKSKHIPGMARWGEMTGFVYPNNTTCSLNSYW